MMVHDTKDDGRRNHANPRERGGGVESRSGERGAKDVVVEAAIVREKARALLVHLLLLGKAHHPRLAHGIEDDIRRQLLDRLRVELRDRGADGGGQGTTGLIIGKRQLADVLAVDPPRHEAVPLTEVHELRPPRNVVLHRLVEIRLELIHVVVVVVAIAVIVDQGLRTGAQTAYMWLVGGSAGGRSPQGPTLRPMPASFHSRRELHRPRAFTTCLAETLSPLFMISLLRRYEAAAAAAEPFAGGSAISALMPAAAWETSTDSLVFCGLALIWAG